MMEKTSKDLYAERKKRIEDVINLRTPDRVPIAPEAACYHVKYSGMTWVDALYDTPKAKSAAAKMLKELEFDAFFPAAFFPGDVYDKIGFKQLCWAGAELDSNRVNSDSVFQFVEPGTGYAAMSAEEYDWFLDDPSDYMVRRHWPRIMGALDPFKNLPPLHTVVSYYAGIRSFLPLFGTQELSESLEALIAAGKKALEQSKLVTQFIEEMIEAGFPPLSLSISVSPFDYFANFFRGTTGCMLDMYRNPEKLQEAIKRVTPWILEWTLEQAQKGSDLTKIIFLPVHKASGGLMSEAQHQEFFWPSLRELIVGLIDAGFYPYVYTEGDYNARLETIRDVPKGKVIYHIESDIFKAKEILGDTACISGGPPGPMMNLGTPDQVRDYCKKLIDIVGKDGGFFMDVELPLITAKSENVKAMVEVTKEYGVY